jgi:6,7-dimethyl-8-ribityllumazine synthase
MRDNLHILIIEADFYRDISDALLDGAKEELDRVDATYEVIQVPGCVAGLMPMLRLAVLFAVKHRTMTPFQKKAPVH